MLRRSILVSIWFGVAILFGTLLGWAEWSRNAMDDLDPAYQRPGTLLPSGLIRAPTLLNRFPRKGHRLVLLFARSLQDQLLFHDLAFQSDIDALADVILVTPDGAVPEISEGIDATVADPRRAIADAYGLRVPRDGGYPIGYALVDRQGFIRHQTLDPHCIGMGHSFELRALLRAML